MGLVKTETADTLRGLSLAEPSVTEGLSGVHRDNLDDSGLDARCHALVGLAALAALGAPPALYGARVREAVEAGVDPDEMLGVLVAVASSIGLARVVAASTALMRALGVPLDAGAGGIR